ncbi:MAG TPA: polymorphic toxin type 33 domain-containing protein [Armatimonadota bacterium]|nr:polymorphic toxin type 33 domain-containing protein [Armatimonadota bacterium]
MLKSGVDPHELKPNSRYDLFKDEDGFIHVLPKKGQGHGDPTGLNINDY